MRYPVTSTPDGAKLAIRVASRASRAAITGIVGEGPSAAIKIVLHAPPVEGRANAALIDFLSEWLQVPSFAVEIVAGRHARDKIVLVRGRSAAEVSSALERNLGAKDQKA